MGVGGGFWDLLKPIAQFEDLDYLRGKRVAIDLSVWIVQQETALKGNARKPHLRVTLFRVINLVSKLGVFPVFVVDGDPPALKSPARMVRFNRMTGVDFLSSQKAECINLERNPVFNRSVEECVELLELMGMPVLRAKGEAEALCAQINREGWVDACITVDSDAFLHGAKCIIKCLQADCKEPIIECYRASDIDTSLGLKRKHLIALALLVGCDYNARGVPGIGLNTAVSIVRLFKEDEILNKLRDLGKGNASSLSEMDTSVLNYEPELPGDMHIKRKRHCSHCGHLGNKGDHMRLGCEACKTLYNEERCVEKSQGFKCECSGCMQEKKRKEHKKCLDWQTKIFSKIRATDGFPNEEIVDIFLGQETTGLPDQQKFVKSFSWKAPQMELLEDFLEHHLYWNRSYTRQKILPLCSMLFLRDMAASKAGLNAQGKKWTLYNRYTPHSIERVKVRYSQSFYVLKWKHVNSESTDDDWLGLKAKAFQQQKKRVSEVHKIQGEFDEDDSAMEVEAVEGSLFITTDEDIKLVRSACPELVDKFQHEKTVKERNKSVSKGKKGRATSTGKQLNITSYFKSTKGPVMSNHKEMSVTLGSNQERSISVVDLTIPLEKSIEIMSTPLAGSTDQGIIDIDPVSQIEANEYSCSLYTSNKGDVEIIQIESPDAMNEEIFTRAVRRCLF
jgi:flap endonuclease GEN